MPESSAPQGVPSSGGNGGIVAMGVILLLAAGGLVMWKSSSGDEQPEEIVEEAAKKTVEKEPEPEVFENAPPPPPEEEEEEEKEEEKPTKAIAGGGAKKPSGPPGCNNECVGTATPALQSALGARGGMSRSCYNMALRNNPNLTGKMTVGVKVSPTGAVCSAYVSNNTLGDPAVTSCVTAKFRAGKYPPPTGGCVTVAVPLNFTKGQ